MKLIIHIIILASLAAILQSCSESHAESRVKKIESASDVQLPELLERSEKLASLEEWSYIQKDYNEARNRVKNSSKNHNATIEMCAILMNEARITGEHGYYYSNALDMLNNLLKNELGDEVKLYALNLKTSVLLSLHQFENAKAIALESLKIDAYNASTYAALVDANVELGDYEEALIMGQKMMDIKPDVVSYSRASYLREIHGDVDESINAMELAVQASVPGSENWAWSLTTLGDICMEYGMDEKAEQAYQAVLKERKNYPFAIAGLAEVETSRDNTAKAEQLLAEAIVVIPEVGFYISMAELCKEQGRMKELNDLREEILVMLADDVNHGHNMDLTYADVYLNLFNDSDKALEYAMKEWNSRPMNIEVNEVLANIYLQRNEWNKVKEHYNVASSTGSVSPDLLEISAAIRSESEKAQKGYSVNKRKSIRVKS